MLFNVHTRIFCRAGVAQSLFLLCEGCAKSIFAARDLLVSPVKKANGQSGELMKSNLKLYKPRGAKTLLPRYKKERFVCWETVLKM